MKLLIIEQLGPGGGGGGECTVDVLSQQPAVVKTVNLLTALGYMW